MTPVGANKETETTRAAEKRNIDITQCFSLTTFKFQSWSILEAKPCQTQIYEAQRCQTWMCANPDIFAQTLGKRKTKIYKMMPTKVALQQLSHVE